MRLRHTSPRGGVATVELAVLLPFLCFLFVISVDYARIFYFAVTVQNCARNGAYYASNYPNNYNLYNDIYGYTSLDDAIMRDADSLITPPTYVVRYDTSPSGTFSLTAKPATDGYVKVTVKWTFQSITNFPGVPKVVNLERTSIMQIAPDMPRFR